MDSADNLLWATSGQRLLFNQRYNPEACSVVLVSMVARQSTCGSLYLPYKRRILAQTKKRELSRSTGQQLRVPIIRKGDAGTGDDGRRIYLYASEFNRWASHDIRLSKFYMISLFDFDIVISTNQATARKATYQLLEARKWWYSGYPWFHGLPRKSRSEASASDEKPATCV